MTTNPYTVNENDSIQEIIDFVHNQDFHHLPVKDATGKLTGIISTADLYRTALKLSTQTGGKTYSKKALSGKKAIDVMSKNPITVKEEDSISVAIELLLHQGFHALPVIDNGKITGIVTSRDVFQYILQQNLLQS